MRLAAPSTMVLGLALIAAAAAAGAARDPSAPRDEGAAFPLHVSADERHLEDARGTPFLLLGDSPQALFVNASVAEAEAYFANRRDYGLNAVWVNLLCATYTGGRPDGATFDGLAPFTAELAPGVPDLTAPNEPYFSRVDAFLDAAEAAGLLVILDPAETGSYLGVLRTNGVARARAYGQFLGARYGARSHVAWMHGNDYQDWADAENDAVTLAVAEGIRDQAPRQMHTLELNYLVSSSVDDERWRDTLDLNATYTYFPTYAQVLKDYARVTDRPSFMVEANYEFEHDWTGNETLRRQEWWTMLSGSAGQLYGNAYSWPVVEGWQEHIDTPGAAQLKVLSEFLRVRAWTGLVPDTAHGLVTAGYGAWTDEGSVNDSDYVTAAATADGALGVAYLPTAAEIRVDLARFARPVAAHWFDPSDGHYEAVADAALPNVGTRRFAHPGPNADGDPDWVLVLETDPPPIPEVPPQPTVAQAAYAVPQQPVSEVEVAFASPQTAGDATLVAVGWNDETATLLSVVDTAGNAYTLATPLARGNGLSQALYVAPRIRGGVTAVRATFDAPARYVDLRAVEYVGLGAPLLVAAVEGHGHGDLADVGPVMVRTDGAFLVMAGMTSTIFQAPGDGFRQRLLTEPDGDLVADRLAATPGRYPARATQSEGDWLLQVAVFAPPPAVTLWRALLPSTLLRSPPAR